MPDFHFTDEDSANIPPPPPPTPPKPAVTPKNEEGPAESAEFSFTGDAPQLPRKPIGPAPPVMPPVTPTAAPATPSNPQRPVGQTQSQAQGNAHPPGHAQGQAPARPLQPRPNPASRPVPTPPIPISLPIETTVSHTVVNDREGAPQDDFSFKIWQVGQTIKAMLDGMEGPASWVLRVAVVCGITALAYVLAGTMIGHAGDLHANPNAAALVKNLALASKVLMIALLAIGITSIILGYEDNRIGIAVGAVGLFCNFAVPIILKKSVGDSPATAGMAPYFRHFGYYLVCIGLVKGVGDTVVWLWGLPEKIKLKHASVGVAGQAEAKQRMIAREANMFSPCWKLPFCRESIRKQCPAFIAKKTCWKFGRGCYCDEEMISRIVRGEAMEAVAAPTRQSMQGKAPCGRCYIYLEHQTYKFRVISPVALPVAVITTWLVWPIYAKVFTVSNNAFDSIFNTLSFNSGKLRPDALATTSDSIKQIAEIGNRPEDVAIIAQNMVGVLLGFMLLIYISKFIEWAIFKAKW